MAGEAARAIALQLKWSMPAVRAFIEDLEAGGVYVTYVPTSGDLCPNCATHYATEETGFCVRCTTEEKLRRQQEADEAEETALREEAERKANEVKQQRKRMRELYEANPRTKPLRKWIEWFAENPDRWEAVISEVEALQREEGPARTGT